MVKEDKIVLVDELDNETGVDLKSNIHKQGTLHRAFSILIFNKEDKLLIQKRASNKYHSGGLWTNTCCSHQREGEILNDSIHRRLIEELGFDTELKEIFKFSYKVRFNNGLIENEVDHVYFGDYNKKITPNPQEIEDYKWVSLDFLFEDIKNNPDYYTYWFKLILEKLKDKRFKTN